MNVDEVYQFMKSEQLAVLATVGEDQRPEAALMGFAVTEELEIVFDTVKSSRKYPNLEEKSTSGLGDWLHNGDYRAI